MKTLVFKAGTETKTGLKGADEIALALGPDKSPRIAAHVGKSVFYGNGGLWTLVASATVKGLQYLPVVDVYGISIVSGGVADVVTGRGRTKGQVDQTYHGPWMTIIDDKNKVEPLQFHGFTEGAVRPVFETENGDANIELWSKDGSYQVFNLVSGTYSNRNDHIGKTGEKLAVAPGGWRAFGGCASLDNSRVMKRGSKPVDVVDCDVYKGAGDDVYGYVGLCVKRTIQGKETAYFAAEMCTGTIRVNKVTDGVALFAPGALPSIGQASKMARHSVQLCVIRGRVAAFWTLAGKIMAVDFDGAIAGQCKPMAICDGSKAAVVASGTGAMMAVIKKDGVSLLTITTTKA
jgi:hypothetical protein